MHPVSPNLGNSHQIEFDGQIGGKTCLFDFGLNSSFKLAPSVFVRGKRKKEGCRLKQQVQGQLDNVTHYQLAL